MPPTRTELAAKHARVRELATVGWPTAAIARELGMDRRNVRKVRAEAGIPALPAGGQQPFTVEEKWRQRTVPLDGGHLGWTGETAANGTPTMRHSGQCYTAARIAYRIQHGTDPDGYAIAGCGMPHCVAPEHIDDTARRLRDRGALRIVLGTGGRPDVCRRSGHDQSVHGRLGPSGVAYCHACKREDRSAARASA